MTKYDCCNDKVPASLNFEKLAKYLYETQWSGSVMHHDGWDKEPSSWQWKRRNEAKEILKFLGIMPDD